MAVLPILEGDIPELRRTSTDVQRFDGFLHTLLKNLADTLTHQGGLGLSAPQIGHSVRVITVDVGDGIQEFINPVIISQVGEVEGFESCLSFPDHTLKIVRPQSIEVEYQNRDGTRLRITCGGLMARVICHEIDHLDGVLFMDHLSDLDLITQVIGESLEDDEDSQQNTVMVAKELELQLMSDTLAELSWKLVLMLEMIEDYPQIQGLMKEGQKEKILEMNEILNALADDIMQQLDV